MCFFHLGRYGFFRCIVILAVFYIHRIGRKNPYQNRSAKNEGTGFFKIQYGAFPHMGQNAFERRDMIRRQFHDERFLFAFKCRMTEYQRDAYGNDNPQ